MDINVKELKERQDKGDKLVLIDVREPREHQEFNVGGTLIPLGQLANHLEQLQEHQDEEVIVYCRSGNRSGMAKNLLKQAGFKNVRNLEGGMLAWVETHGQ